LAWQAEVMARRRWETLEPEEKLEKLEKSHAEERERMRVEGAKMGRREKAEMEARLKDIREQITDLRVVVGRRKREMQKLKVGPSFDAAACKRSLPRIW
jgi:hypothetical protein